MIDSITLLNSRILECYPITKLNPIPSSIDMFYANVYNFILNADEIMSDSRYFLSSVGFYPAINNDFMPCLGAFVEWWKFRYQYSWDANDYPIWDIGARGCLTVDIEGNLHNAVLRNQFIEIVKSFNRISNRYIEAQKECESYSLDYVITRLPIKI